MRNFESSKISGRVRKPRKNLEKKESCSGKNLSLIKRECSLNKLALLYDRKILYYKTLQPTPATYRNIISYQT